MNIHEELRKEIARNKALLPTITGNSPEDAFRRKTITIDLELAEKAMNNDDIIKMMRMYNYMRKNK